jgi:hypothetical protein
MRTISARFSRESPANEGARDRRPAVDRNLHDLQREFPFVPDFRRASDGICGGSSGARFLQLLLCSRAGAIWRPVHVAVFGEFMKLAAAARATVPMILLATLGCQEPRPFSPTAASLFIPNVEGVWSGPMTLLTARGGECVGAVVNTFLPPTDRGTVTIAQTADELSATMTMESTGLACKYTGSATVNSIAVNATSCDRTGLIVTCLDGRARELRLVGSSVTANWNGNQVAGSVSSTYNVFEAGGSQDGVGSLITNHDFVATRR